MPRYRVIDDAGSEVGIYDLDIDEMAPGMVVTFQGSEREVLDVYDDEHGKDGDVEATIVLEV
jgi:hypothetical protein